MSENRAQHWADAIAQEVLQGQSRHLISTGITPSGDYHVGHLREVMTAEGVYRALVDQGAEVRFNYIADTMDPLRRVYDFLDPEMYEDEVGKPLCDIPCPCGDHASYAEHFLEPFLESMQKLGVELDVIYAHDLYRQGHLDAQIIMALEQTETIKRIEHEESRKEVAADWSPFNPLCAACGRLADTRVTGFDADAKTVSYHCACGHEETAPVSQAGKLTWRVDWPARWHALGVTIEPFGKDHASRGGSYDTGKRVIREVFHGEPPYPIPYEWLALRGQGDMSSSKGNLVSIDNLTRTVPPEVARYMIFRAKPLRHIAFDPGLPLLNLVDEYDNVESNNRNSRAADLALMEAWPPLGIPFKHLVNLVQITDGDVDKIIAILQRHDSPMPSREVLQNRIAYAHYWVENYAPPEVRLQLQETLPDSVAALTPEQREALSTLANRLQEDMSGDDIHALVYSLTEDIGIQPKALFQAVYTAFLGQPRGPRVGWFLGSLEFEFVRTRLQEAAGAGV